MKIKTIYTPSDTEGRDVNFNNLFTLADLEKLGESLAKAGVQGDEALEFSVASDGSLTIVVHKWV